MGRWGMGTTLRVGRTRPARDVSAIRAAVDAGSSCIVRDRMVAGAVCGARRKHPLPSIGDRFGKLTITGFVTGTRSGLVACAVQCDCGQPEHFVVFDSLRNGNCLRCDACSRRQQHATRKLYWRYAGVVPDDDHRRRLLNRIASILGRCLNPKAAHYHNYGGRGITVYPPWQKDRAAFLRYLVTLPGWDQPALELDRENVDGGYEPGNLRFITRRANIQNQRRVRTMQARIDALETEVADLRSRLRRAAQPVHDNDQPRTADRP